MGVSDKFPRTWVPLASAYELNPHRPNSVWFLGKEYIVYYEGDYDDDKDAAAAPDGKWIVCDSVCPHRLAPLSEGRINEQHQLECSYHGWAFNGTGQLQRIPQIPESELARQQKNKCSSIATYTTVVEKNLIWAWLWDDDGKDEDDDSSSSALTATGTPEYQLQGVVQENSTTYTRDLPYSYDTLLENIVDPSHVPWAHHGLQGKRTDAVPINLTMTSTTNASGFTFDFQDRTMGKYRQGSGIFRAPYVIHYAAEFAPDSSSSETKKQNKDDGAPRPFNLTAVMTPTRPGWSRIMLFGPPKDKPAAKKKSSLVLKIFQSLPLWLVHQLNNRFLDSDLAFLHYQERNRQTRSYFMPAQSDLCVGALRTWVQKYFYPSSSPPTLPPAITDRRVLFDRHTQHTDQCRHCTRARNAVQKWRRRTYVGLAASFVLLPSQNLAVRLCLGGVASLVGLLLLQAYHWVETSMEQGEFKHCEND